MSAAVRQESRIFAILALGLLITTQHLGYYMGIAYRLQPSQVNWHIGFTKKCRMQRRNHVTRVYDSWHRRQFTRRFH